ncbi:MAG: Tyrosine recombinase XerH [uncultured Sulfurovum sp.]|uniref:Tyrosine recombinase XerH n=1 Tax=uncultured Sulfurovum sp. TaxID=269237 RepID=A0A6S6SNQ9_9BACT|nr:MAG: Tyrosine recombinase XerH [uncultured Sulfurovum sp.]
MKHKLTPYNNAQKDLLFWIKEYIGSKVLTISINKKYANTFDRMKAHSQLMSATTIKNFKAIQIDIRSKGLSTLITYTNPLLSLYEFFESQPKLKQLTDFNTDYRDKIFIANKKKYSEKTQVGYLIQINSLFKYIENNSIDDSGEVPNFNLGRTRGGKRTITPIKKEDKKVTYLSPSEIKRFINGMETYPFRGEHTAKPKLMMKLALFGGLGGDELSSILRDNIKLISNPTGLLIGSYIRVIIEGKGNKQRIVYIKEELLSKEYHSHMKYTINCEDGLLFCSDNNKKYTASAIYQQTDRLLHHAGIDKGTSGIHLLRRSYACMLAINDVDFSIISELLGHGNEEVTELYVDISREDMRPVVKVWEGF